ncbi:hypothetical protein MGYG_04372 [Nannizzia gypsea CBS 118893]|uniref:Uncharacterized protein n=1 Tax=Arthroderma gypseum (strain ATCC MYA-4604 / CBS 118893) TaxID=535722 RepID=E4USL4_ARTGP|nr:hypothetical protein MGYG_04372 [Nannizzia gypsea CBS 118893]EFR01365.1 hypothetical protein MGYG_04372 [Nannizzia gypsea CBS 118893]
MGRDEPEWIGDRFEDCMVEFPDGSQWKFGEKISEKCGDFYADRKMEIVLSESQAVYHCHQQEGPRVGLEAILKVRMQVPSEYPAHPDPFVRSQEAMRRGVSGATSTELRTLKYLNEKGCTVVPRLLNSITYSQDISMLVPKGYLVILVMEKCPGVVLSDFWDYEKPKRDKIRKAFRRDYRELISYSAHATDPGLRNIIYDEVEDKCWFIDHEHTSILKSDKEEATSENLPVRRSDFVRWELENWRPEDYEMSGQDYDKHDDSDSS